MSDEVVYVIGTPSSTVVKIGRTRRLERRLADIQRMSPVPLAVLGPLGGHELETNLHRHFAGIRSHGEWFAFEEAPVPAVEQAVRTAPWNTPKPPRAKPLPKVLPKPRQPNRELPHPDASPLILPAGLQDELSRLPSIESRTDRVRQIKEPVIRFQAARWVRQQIAMEDERLRLKQKLLVERMKDGRTWAQVGAILGVSGSRAEAFVKGR